MLPFERSLYLDQNVLQSLADGKLDQLLDVEFTCVYSMTHLEETHRGHFRMNSPILDVLDRLNAVCITPEVGKKGIADRMWYEENDQASTIYQKNVRLLENQKDDQRTHVEILASLLGGRKIERHQVDEIARHLFEGVDREMGELESTCLRESFAEALSRFQLHMKRPVEYRELLDVPRLGNLDSLGHPIIREVWQAIKERTGLERAEHMFGDPSGDCRMQGMVKSYTALNLLGYHPDKSFAKQTRIPASQSDAMHVAQASVCDALVSFDKQMCFKACAIYDYYGVSTRVVLLRDDE